MFKKIVSVVSLLGFLIFGTVAGFAAEKVPASEREITFEGEDGYTLYGTLSIPEHNKDEKLSAVLLVHGSGPNDRDETLDAGGGIKLKPFMEMAKSLQKKGYVVLRYDKRSFTMLQNGYNKEEFDKILPDHFINDARYALDFLKTLPEVDENKVILVGHSQGGSLAPQIAEDKDLAGVVLLAPGLLPIREQMIYQLQYQIDYLENINQMGQFDQGISQLQTLLDQLKAAFEMIDNGTFPEGGSIMGASLAFMERWGELTVNTPKLVVEISAPTLLINGTVDMLSPAEVIKEKEPYLIENKDDIEVVYIENLTHHLYYMSSAIFVEQIPAKIDEWLLKQSGFNK